MRTRSLFVRAAAAVVAAALIGPASAAATPTTIGSDLTGAPNAYCSGTNDCTVINIDEPSGTPTAPSNGVITSFKVKHAAITPSIAQVQLDVFSGTSPTFTVAARSEQFQFPSSGAATDQFVPLDANLHPKGVAIATGQHFGVYVYDGSAVNTDDGVNFMTADRPSYTVAYNTSGQFNVNDTGTFSLAGDSTTGYESLLQAKLEPDADGDGYGDDTQDNCPTIANDQTSNPCPGTLIVNKACNPANDTGKFDIKVDGDTKATDVTCGGTTGSISVPVGSHNITESAGTGTDGSSYYATFGGACNSSGAVTLAAGETKTCTLTNTRKAYLTVNKACSPTGDPGKFNLRVDGVTKGTDVACGGTTGTVGVFPGTHTVSETAGTGTSLSNYTSSIGGACNTSGAVTLAAGETKTCTITNTRVATGTLTVNKVCSPTSDPGKFNLRIDAVTKKADAACGGTTGAVTVPVGSHTVSETAGTGTDVSNYSAAFSGACSSTGTVSVAAGEAKTCTITNTRRTALGPDTLVFDDTGAASNPDIYSYDTQTQVRKQLTANNATDSVPAISPDRKRIAFVSNRSGSYQIYTMAYNGTNVVQLTHKGANYEPAWSPDGTKIVYDCNRHGDPIYLQLCWVSSTTGQAGGVHQITTHSHDPYERFDEPAWSPNGKKILYVHRVAGHSNPNRVWVMKTDGSNRVNLSGTSTAVDTDPAWSPDGTKIAFAREVNGNSARVATMTASGGSKTILPTSPNLSYASGRPTWSPVSGTYLVYSYGGDHSLHFIPSAGGSASAAMTHGDHPSWGS
jgi:hypothetical protein